jgi:hypothetical protein
MNKTLIRVIFYVLVVGVAFGAAQLYFRATAPSATRAPSPIASSSSGGQEPSTNNPTCIITIDGNKYDVEPLRSTHPGGDVFVCGTDMSDVYHGQHGSSLRRMQPYLVK